MDFKRYTSRILFLNDIYDNNSKRENEAKIRQQRFQVKNTEMKMTSILKSRFSSLNDKRYYFSDGITCLPFGHPLLEIGQDIKKQFKRKIPKRIHEVKDELLKEKRRVSNKCEKISVLIFICEQPFIYYKLDSNKRHHIDTLKFDLATTRDYMLGGYWF